MYDDAYIVRCNASIGQVALALIAAGLEVSVRELDSAGNERSSRPEPLRSAGPFGTLDSSSR